MDPALVQAVTLATGLGVGTVLPFALTWIKEAVTGRASRKRDDVETAWAEVLKARAALDREAKVRRITQESLLKHRRIMLENAAFDSNALPEWPASSPDTGPIPKE